MSTDTAQLDSLTQRLETVATNLHGYLEERARELAEPYIAVAEKLANRRIAEAEAEAQRERDVVAELRRQLATRERQLIRAEHALGKTHNPGNCEQCDAERRASRA